MPVYKGASYIGKAIDSIINQTYSNWELVISDQTPDDSCERIILDFKDPRIRYFKNDQKGIFSNLNNAIQHSVAYQIQIFCQDDIMFPNMIYEQVKMSEKYPEAGMIVANMVNLSSEGKIFPLKDKFNERIAIPEKIEAISASKYFLIFGCFPGNLSPVMITRKAYHKLGPFNQDYPHSGDLEYWVRFSNKFDIVFNRNNLLAVRTHNGQAGNFMQIEQPLVDRYYIFKHLYEQNLSQTKNRYRLIWYINQSIGVQHLYLVLKTILMSGKRKKSGVAMRLLFKSPLSFFASLVLLFLTVNGRFKIIKMNIDNFRH